MQDWKKRHLRCPTAPLDLVFDGKQFEGCPLDESLRESLLDRAARGTIRRIHLVSEDSKLLGSILSPLTVSNDGIRTSSVESVVIWDESEDGAADLSDFFANHRFPKLQRLELDGLMISSWDLIISRATVLTTLYLGCCYYSPPLTTSKLLSIFASNPTLQNITLFPSVIPEDGDGNSSTRAQLPNLRMLDLSGDGQHIFELLHRLDYPQNMDSLSIHLLGCMAEEVSQIVGPCLRDYLRRRGSSRGLWLSLLSTDAIELYLGDVGGININFPSSRPALTKRFVKIKIGHMTDFPECTRWEVTLNLLEHLPHKDILHLQVEGEPICMKDVSARFPYIRAVQFVGRPLDAVFRDLILNTNEEIFPSLGRVILDQVVEGGGDWSALMTFLASRASSGNQLDSLEIQGTFTMDPKVEEGIRRLVRDLRLTRVERVYFY